MPFRLADRWVWDFWFVNHGPETHLFYLQAPHSLEQEERRHAHASIGHAVSRDLRSWRILPDALQADANPTAWDSFATWTGSIIRHGGRWWMLYTGTSRTEDGLRQRIGAALSDDLIRWEKHPANPLIELDPRWYEPLDLTLWHDQAWRDPWVFRHGGRFHVLITARVNQGPADGRGVIGHAVSDDLVRWEVRPPLTEPGDFGQMEVPQLVEVSGRWMLLFSATGKDHSAARVARTGQPRMTGIHYFVGGGPLGPFAPLSDEFLVGDAEGRFYSGKLIRDDTGAWQFMAFRNFEAGEFVGEITDPMPVEVLANGRLRVKGP